MNELGYMPKEGWTEVLQSICPMCGKTLRGPTADDKIWIEEEPYSLFTGAMAVPVCCKVWMVWRLSDKLWHYEIRDHFRWLHRGDKKHELNSRDVHSGSQGRESGPSDSPVSKDSRGVMPDVGTGSNEELPAPRGLSKQYDF